MLEKQLYLLTKVCLQLFWGPNPDLLHCPRRQLLSCYEKAGLAGLGALAEVSKNCLASPALPSKYSIRPSSTRGGKRLIVGHDVVLTLGSLSLHTAR